MMNRYACMKFLFISLLFPYVLSRTVFRESPFHGEFSNGKTDKTNGKLDQPENDELEIIVEGRPEGSQLRSVAGVIPDVDSSAPENESPSTVIHDLGQVELGGEDSDDDDDDVRNRLLYISL